MEQRKLLFFALLSTVMLAACQNQNLSSSAADSSIFSTSVNVINKDITTSGILIDVAVGANLAVGNTYAFSVSFSSASNTGTTVEFSDDSVAEASSLDGTNWQMHVKKASDVVIVIKDNTGFTHYRNVLHCRNKLNQKEMNAYLVNVDHWQSWLFEGNNLKIVFLGDGTATISGYDEGVNMGTVTFDYVYDSSYYENGVTSANSANETGLPDEYVYAVSNFSNKVTSLLPRLIQVNATGEMMHLIQGSGESQLTAAVFTPVIVA
jgi:hypothetical protein